MLTVDQIIIFALLGAVFVALLSGRLRYDVVAFTALVVALLVGVVPVDQAFSGFGHPATVAIALVLVVSRGLALSVAIEVLGRKLLKGARSLGAHIGLMSTVAAAMSALMNNVAVPRLPRG
ncbi:MAG: hypothetical protein HOI95_12760 [Chromatiales bacterium]|jgi:di/tricarboxylate transporter|nr:hypothetical protein [Chromatiales bacterium]